MRDLKEMLKPPFYWGIDGCCIHTDESRGPLLTIGGSRGIGDECYLLNDDTFYRQFQEFVVIALNEKYQRDFGERKRWIRKGVLGSHQCPDCESIFGFSGNPYLYCPHCEVRLDPPEDTDEFGEAAQELLDSFGEGD